MTEKILVIGAGIAGLCTALALGPTGKSLTLIERDGPPPEGSPDEAFQDWTRRGVGQLRQSHAFLARLNMIIKSDHPTLHKELLDVGVRELGFEGMLSPLQKPTYQPTQEDADLSILTSRRTTLELVIRRYVERLPNITIRSNLFVRSLISETNADGIVTITGLRGEDESGPVEILADMVIDASGKNGSTIDQLMSANVPISETAESAGILYFTRHYRLKPGQVEPSRDDNPPATGDLGYLKFGVFPADNGCYSITLCAPEIEYEMRKAIVHPKTWDAIVANIPGLKVWTDETRSEPVSKVFGMGNLVSRWRELAPGEVPAVLGFFAVGDTLIRTNPLYGRGCSFAAVAAYALRDVLTLHSEPKARLLAYQQRLQSDLKPYFDVMQRQDRGSVKRAEQILTPDYKPRLRTRILLSFFEDGIGPAIRTETNLLREALRGFHMLEHPDAWLRRPANLVRILGYWAKSKKSKAGAYPPKLGPDRSEMMQALGLCPDADIAILAQARSKDHLAVAA